MTGVFDRRTILAGIMAGVSLPSVAFAAARPVPALYLQRITDDVWMHVSWIDYGQSFGPSNGLVVRCGDRAVLVDTPCTEAYTADLLDRIRMPVDRLLVTHAHSDRMAGMQLAMSRGIPSLMKDIGVRKSVALGYGEPTAAWEGTDHAITVNGRRFELFYPGGAHSYDNSVVYLPDEKLLFGGCMLRGAAATSPGGTQFADVCGWSKSLHAIERRFPDMRIVVPGHGEPGGPPILRHTARLITPEFEQRGCD